MRMIFEIKKAGLHEKPGRQMHAFGGYISCKGVFACLGLLVGAVMLASLIIPIPSRHHPTSRAANNLKQIITAQLCYAEGGSHPRVISEPVSVNDYAVFLTRVEPGINDARLWFIIEDDRLEHLDLTLTEVLNRKEDGSMIPDERFLAAHPKSWAIVVNIPANADGNYPVAWTRGLSGTKWSKDSPWEGKGGHIAFLNGSVTWLDDTVGDDGKGIFIDFITKQPTSDIRAAIGPGARILEDR